MTIILGRTTASFISLSRATEELTSSNERLASGLRINRASDDAAGLAIASSLNATSRIYAQSLRNLNDGISAISIAAGAMSELSGLITRLQELAAQSANGVFSATQRRGLDSEAQALREEFNRVARTTSFNGISLLDPATGSLRLQAGDTSDHAALYLDTSLEMSVINDGTFETRQVYSTGSTPSAVIASELTGDGIVDLVSVNSASGRFDVLIGNGDGTFQARASYFANTGSASVHSGLVLDANGDGYMDLISASTASSQVFVNFGNGNGSFRAPVSYSAPSGGGTSYLVAAGDLNTDGIEDIVVANTVSDGFNVMLGNGDGSFSSETYLMGGIPNVLSVTIGDFNGDGYLDVAGARDSSARLSVAFGNGDGTFTIGTSYASGGVGATMYSVTNGDFNGDGFLDLAAADRVNGQVVVLTGNGNGTFKAAISYAVGADNRHLFTQDLNGDDILDIISVDGTDGVLSLLVGNGDGTFKTRISYAVGSTPRGAVAADLDGDGVFDLISADAGGNTLSILLGNGQDSSRLRSFEISTQSAARSALALFQSAQERLAQNLGELGSQESRLRSALSNLRVTKENYHAATSRIEEADVATEIANNIRASIRQQLSVAIIAQARQIPQLALRLLGG